MRGFRALVHGIPDNAGVTDLRAAAEAWLAEDPDPVTVAELRRLLDAGDAAAIHDRFAVRLPFGTAGIRGALGAGPGRMNRALVRRVTAGLAARLAQEPDARERGVVVGRDARRGSRDFAADVAAVLAGAGFRVHVLPSPNPTPLVPFAVTRLGAAAGVQITASHNPAADNGYKVYWGDGPQIAPPLDTQIATAIDAVEAAYVAAVLALVDLDGPRDVRIVHTAMHGVGGALAVRLLNAAGFGHVHPVPEQHTPDPDFPTVAFPNPEEPGAMDLALALAAQVDADLVIANDPDADRIAVAVPLPDGTWRALSGDEVGCVLAEHLLRGGSGDRWVATTVVSSVLLGRIAKEHGVRFARTLTGFKWLARSAVAAQAGGATPVLAYEQALGVMVGTAVLDKDGLSAAVVVADLAARLHAEGRTLLDAVDDLAVRHGLHVTGGRSLRLEGPEGLAVVDRVLAHLRAAPPVSVGGIAVTGATDYAEGIADLPPTDLLAYDLADGSSLQVRPSGTEPLLKLYAEVVQPVIAADVAAARTRAQQRLDAVADAWLAIAQAASRPG